MIKFKIINFKSKPKKTPFAPEWNYFMCETLFKDINCKNLSKFLLSKQKEILKLDLTIRSDSSDYTDGFTGLGSNTTTARFGKYNVFNFKNKEVQKLKKAIIESHNFFLKALNVPSPDSLYIQCWYNVMDKGQKIKAHLHGVDPTSYLGGHFCVQVKDTSTYYINSINQLNKPNAYESKNEIGKLTLFQSCIPHYTDENKDDSKRITIAFDLFTEEARDNLIKLF